MSRRPNILFLMTDQMQGRVLEPGHPCRTPNFDRLARRGVRITKAVTPNPVCSPARCSLMTGRMPHSHGVVQVLHTATPQQTHLDPTLPHWAQRLTDAGYRTAIAGKWNASQDRQPQNYGWQLVLTPEDLPPEQQPKGKEEATLEHTVYVDQPPGYPSSLLAAVTDQAAERRGPGVVANLAERFLDQVLEGEQPWAIYASTGAPHDPFIAGREAFRQYDPQQLPLPPNAEDDLSDKPGLYRKAARAFGNLSEKQKRHVMACYYAMITEIDEQFGRLIDKLEAAGALENTIVVLASDHGEALGAHRQYLKNTGAFEEIYHIPMLLAGPGIAQGKIAESRVGLADLCPTLCELTGVEPIETEESRSFAPLLRDPEGEAPHYQSAYAEYFGTRFWLTQRVVWEDPWKLVVNGFDEDELYNLQEDPWEMRNRIHDPEAAAALERLTQRFWRTVERTRDDPLAGAFYPSLRYAPFGPGPVSEPKKARHNPPSA